MIYSPNPFDPLLGTIRPVLRPWNRTVSAPEPREKAKVQTAVADLS